MRISDEALASRGLEVERVDRARSERDLHRHATRIAALYQVLHAQRNVVAALAHRAYEIIRRRHDREIGIIRLQVERRGRLRVALEGNASFYTERAVRQRIAIERTNEA